MCARRRRRRGPASTLPVHLTSPRQHGSSAAGRTRRPDTTLPGWGVPPPASPVPGPRSRTARRYPVPRTLRAALLPMPLGPPMVLAVLALLLCHAPPASAVQAQRPPVLAGEAAAVAALLQRKLPGSSSQFLLQVSPHACRAATCFRLADAPGGRISVTGTSASELSAGVGHYLREHCNMTMGWGRGGGSRFVAPPAGAWPRVGSAGVVVRRTGQWSFAENVCTSSYTLAWHSWQQWEEFLDWAALWGINLLPALTGQEEVQYKVFRGLGLSDAEVRGWFNGPALLTWSRGQNGHGSGELGPLPRSWMKAQWRLQKFQILPRMRSLGIAGQLPAFQGNVPWVLASKLPPGSNMSQGGGMGNGTGWMDSRDPNFARIADLWMTTMLTDFGTIGHIYQMDGFFASTGWGATDDSKSTFAAAGELPACEYGPEQKDVYLAGEAADNGKSYSTLGAAKAACSADVTCGGALSRSCNRNNTVCTAFQTRAGWGRDGVPRVTPVPKTAGVQNSFVITNAQACGHHAARHPHPPAPPPAPHPPAPPGPPASAQCPACPPCEWKVQHEYGLQDCPSVGCMSYGTVAEAQAACEHVPDCNGVNIDSSGGRPYLAKKNIAFHSPGSTAYTIANNIVCRNFTVDPDFLSRGRAGYAGIARIDPNATWAYQGYAIGVAGWSLFYVPTPQGLSQLLGFVTAPPKGKFLLIDMSANGEGQWRNFLGTWRAEFIWTSIHTYGGNDGMKGNLSRANRIPFDAVDSPVEHGNVGSGFTPEGFDQNPVYYEVIQGAPWRSGPIDNMSRHVVRRAHRRYGLARHSPAVAEAWTLLEQSSYAEDLGVGDDTGVGQFPLVPVSSYKRSLPHWSSNLTQPSAGLCKTWAAWGRLIDASSEVGVAEPFRYDLVNTGREILAQLSTVLSIRFARALGATPMNSAALNRTGRAYVELLLDLDGLVATDAAFLLGPWLRDARAWGVVNGSAMHDCTGTVVDAVLQGDCPRFLEWNARCQLTTWYPTPASKPMPLRDTDYARKHWSPLIRDYYARRAAMLLTQALSDATANKPLDMAAVLRLRAQLAFEWTTRTDRYSEVPAPNFVDVSKAARTKYATMFASCDMR
jgi:hypothetical protein